MNYSNDLRDLLVEQLKELILLNRVVADALPDVEYKITNKSYLKLFRELLTNNHCQWHRLVVAFQMLNENLIYEPITTMSEMPELPLTLAELAGEPEQVDRAVLSQVVEMEQFQMAGYGAAAIYADTLGYCGVADLLENTLKEKSDINKKIRSRIKKLSNA